MKTNKESVLRVSVDLSEEDIEAAIKQYVELKCGMYGWEMSKLTLSIRGSGAPKSGQLTGLCRERRYARAEEALGNVPQVTQNTPVTQPAS